MQCPNRSERGVVRGVVCLAVGTLLTANLLHSGDLSRYREFQFGMDLATVARLTQLDPSRAKVIHRRPAVLEEIEWRPLGIISISDPLLESIFSFYDGGLYRVFTTYDLHKTDGLTVDDITQSLIGLYGNTTVHPAATITVSSYLGPDNAAVLAQWDSEEYSLSLVRLSYQARFGLVWLSKRTDNTAREATAAATLIEAQEAPQREADLRKEQAETERTDREKARLANRPNFRP
jgi:hypothetical protein